MQQISMKPGTLLSPVPVALIGAGAEGPDGTPVRNLMTAAWVGTVCSYPPMVSVSIRPGRYTRELVDRTGEFTVNLTTRSMMEGTDFCGVRSGRDEDKFARCGWTPVTAGELKWAPGVAESPVTLGCLVRQRLELGSHILYIGEIVHMGVREDLLDEKGGSNLHREALVTYTHGVYSTTGAPEGFFGYSVAAPKVLSRRMKTLKGGMPKGSAKKKNTREKRED